MSHPTAISPDEQEQMARRIGVLLLQGAPEDWQQITVEYRATGEYHDMLAETVRQDGSTTEPWDPPEELLGIFERLREGMYRPDVGTWLSALYIVERPSSYRIDINFDEEPQWQQPLPRAAYVDELRRYPRSDDNVPDWMRDKLDGSGKAASWAQPLPQQMPGAPDDGTGPMPRATGSSHFRTARVFDDADEQGRPLITTRNPIPPEDSAALRQYLENAPVVLAAQDNEPDQLDPSQPAVVPGTWHTDGVWLWQGAVAYYLAQYGVPPESELVEHARARRFGLAEIDEGTRDAAVGVLMAPPGLGDLDSAHGYDPVLDGAGLDDPVLDGAVLDDPVVDDAVLDDPVVDDAATDVGEQVPAAAAAEDPGGDRPAAEQAAGTFAPPVDSDAPPSDVDLTPRATGSGFDQQDDLSAPTTNGAGAPVDEPGEDPADPGLPGAPIDVAGTRDAQDVPGPASDQAAPGTHVATAPAAPEAHPAPTDGAVESEDREVRPDTSATAPARHGRSDEDDEVDSADSEVIFADLRELLDTHGAVRDGYLIGEHAQTCWSLHDEGSDWVVTGPRADHHEVRFARPEQAAAYLLGSVLMSPVPGTASEGAESGGAESEGAESDEEPEAAAIGVPEPTEDGEDDLVDDSDVLDQDESATPAPATDDVEAPEPRTEQQPERPTDRANDRATESPGLADLPRRAPNHAPAETGGNFLFTANQTIPSEDAEPALGEAPGGERSEFAGDRPHFADEAANGGHEQQAPASPAPQAPIGQPMQAPPPAAPNGAPPAGQVPPPLPKRPPRAERGEAAPQAPDAVNRRPAPGQPHTQQPPPHAPAGSQPGGSAGPDQRHGAGPASGGPTPGAPAPGAPGRQGPPQHGPAGLPQRPPQQGTAPGPPPPQNGQAQNGQAQNGPAQNGQAQAGQAPPNRGPEQAIQPLHGEPPLTLFRDRRTMMLQPGTEIDRYGEPHGNVLYAARTPYGQRSLPPQWANRTYFAYRVQRPVQALRGTAVPWFEQPGGGTAYVLPVSVSDLLADGTLAALTGPDAPPRPPLE